MIQENFPEIKKDLKLHIERVDPKPENTNPEWPAPKHSRKITGLLKKKKNPFINLENMSIWFNKWKKFKLLSDFSTATLYAKRK